MSMSVQLLTFHNRIAAEQIFIRNSDYILLPMVSHFISLE